MVSYKQLILWIATVGLIVLFPFYILYLQSHGDVGSSGIIPRPGDGEILENLESIMKSLEKEQKLLNEIVDHVDQLIDQAALALKNGSGSNSNIDNIRNALIESKSQFKYEESVNSISSQTPSKVFPSSMQLSLGDTNFKSEGSILVVGGTDGSGTRRVVQILTELGVRIVSEDPETYDIHADGVGGWPPTVSTVLKETKSINYDPSTLRRDIYKKANSAVNVILKQAEEDSHKPTSTKLAVGGLLQIPKGKEAKGVSYGFKAPVSMTLVPLWADSLNDFKFLHVLRDGRDIAFSANQGPVEKFFNVMYGNKRSGDLAVDAIRLWSDWNSQVYQWFQAQKSIPKSSKRLSYFALHSEDIVSESINIRFAAIYSLAKWVDSNLSDDELCCLSMKGAEFLGSHERDLREKINSSNEVKSRYGKWRSLLQGNKARENSIESAGKEALSLFGYSPERKLADSTDSTPGGYKCKLSVKKCQDKGFIASIVSSSDPLSKGTLNSVYSGSSVCKVYVNVDYKGGDLRSIPFREDDPEHCCRDCKQDKQCHHFTIDLDGKVCYLKHSRGVVTGNRDLVGKNLVSGDS